jgi:hypothetical protein
VWFNEKLRIFVNNYQDNWSKFIPALDTAHWGMPYDSIGL